MSQFTKYSASEMIGRIKLRSFVGATSSLQDPDFLDLMNDSFRSYIVEFLKPLRQEWWVAKDDFISTTQDNGRFTLPGSVASSIRTISWKNNAYLTPLDLITPEASFQYQNNSGQPSGFMMKGYDVIILPQTTANYEIHVSYLKNPPDMVLEEDAGKITSATANTLTLKTIPLNWQSAELPFNVDLISSNDPFSVTQSGLTISAIDVSTATVTINNIPTGSELVNNWIADVGFSPFPNIPVALHPLLAQDVVCTIMEMSGDPRLKGSSSKKDKLETALRTTFMPRAQGSSTVIVNPLGPGMRAGQFGFGGYRGSGGR